MQTISIRTRELPPANAGRVLVVEDEFLIRMIVSDYLREIGFTVVEACSGDEAVAVLRSGVLFDVVFTDVRMPGSTDGLALLAYVRATQPDLPVVVTSGHLLPALALAGGAVEFLAKPCGLEQVAEALCAATSGR